MQRFLFVFGLFFFFIYLGLGLMFILWKSIPLEIEYTNRVLFGILLIIYAIFRFYRLLK
ncbi:hypothetical protein SAMN04487893_11165 [Myroides guanonis]|uniref:Uncharacterized protein n=1 Tax=Myroides guanonis TaxID=1150112 RepID=A0A1I3SVZ6_9FLAO|nr:hypothetical protein SAMN04487893_11165 [Myroides guanonis]